MSRSSQGPRKPATKFPHLQKKLRQNAVPKSKVGKLDGTHRGGKGSDPRPCPGRISPGHG